MQIAVIGAGLIGVTTAHHLARRGHRVTLLERAAAPASGASHANGGMLTPSMADPWNAPGVWRDLLRWIGREEAPMLLRPRALPSIIGWGLRFISASSASRYHDNTLRNLRLAAYSVAGMAPLRSTAALAYHAGTHGTLKLYRDPRAFEAAARNATPLAPGLVEVHALDRRQVLDLVPALADIGERIAGGLHFPRDESGDARLFTEQLCADAVHHGVTLQLGREVLGIDVEAGAVRALRTTRGSLRADAVVVAAGCHAAALLRGLGPRLPIAPVKGYSITCIPREGDAAPAPLPLPIVDDALHAALTPLGTSLRIAGTAEFAGFDTRLDASRLDNLRGLLAAVLPAHAPGLLSGTVVPWAGLRPMSADGVPFIGPYGPRGLYVNAGHGHLGWTMADGSARLLADLVEDGTPALDPADYSPQRFA
jgi:D-amino-acid dehydrogenase